MSYDIPKIATRLEILGEDPLKYFCHPDFERQAFRYNYDQIFKNDFKNKTESVTCTSYISFVDQMLTYAGIRFQSCYTVMYNNNLLNCWEV